MKSTKCNLVVSDEHLTSVSRMFVRRVGRDEQSSAQSIQGETFLSLKNKLCLLSSSERLNRKRPDWTETNNWVSCSAVEPLSRFSSIVQQRRLSPSLGTNYIWSWKSKHTRPAADARSSYHTAAQHVSSAAVLFKSQQWHLFFFLLTGTWGQMSLCYNS